MEIIDLDDFFAEIELSTEMGWIDQLQPKTRYLEYHAYHRWIRLEVSANRFLDDLLRFDYDSQKKIVHELLAAVCDNERERIFLESKRTDAKGKVHRSAVYVSWWQKGVEGERPHILQIIPA
jgi:hypothetical protein